MMTKFQVSSDVNGEESLQGLSDAEAAERATRFGFNELPTSKPRSIFQIGLSVIKEPMLLLLLLGCGGAYLLLGDAQEAVILLLMVAVVISITLYQERKRGGAGRHSGFVRG